MDRGTWWTPVRGDMIEVIEHVHTPGWFTQNHLFPTLLEAGKSKTEELTDSVPTENPVTSLQDESRAQQLECSPCTPQLEKKPAQQ